MIKKIKRPISMAEAAMKGIRSSIIKGELGLGQQLTESYLAELFGFSKTPIREGLALLKSEGLVVSEVHKGFRVFKMDENELSEFCELRFALESQALSSSFTKNRLKLIRKLKKLIKEMEDCTKNKTYSLHIIGMSETIRTHTQNHNHSIISSLNDHKEIFYYIEENNISKANDALDSHINYWINDRLEKITNNQIA